jgi:glycosyltransferase involved in cell wall biosynthesis
LLYNRRMKVALVHDYLNQYGGAEKTLEAIMEIYPDAPIYTGIYSRTKMPKSINERNIYAIKNPVVGKFYKYFTFLMPLVFENFDLSEYDLIISDGTAWPKSVITKPHQLHISYIHTPPRFLYKYTVESSKRSNPIFKPFISIIDHFLRTWDFTAAQRPDYLITNSNETRARINKFYRRDATVINPPVQVNTTGTKSFNNLQKPYYLALGRLVAYKNFDVLINAFNLLGLPLVVIGTGTEESRLKKISGTNITFTGKVSEQEKHNLIEGSMGLINTVQDEDFGIVPIEVMAHGKPVLAHRSGGHKEIVKEGLNGMFFEELRVETLVDKIKEFDNRIKDGGFDQEKIKASVQKYGKERFQSELKSFIDDKIKTRWA